MDFKYLVMQAIVYDTRLLRKIIRNHTMDVRFSLVKKYDKTSRMTARHGLRHQRCSKIVKCGTAITHPNGCGCCARAGGGGDGVPCRAPGTAATGDVLLRCAPTPDPDSYCQQLSAGRPSVTRVKRNQ